MAATLGSSSTNANLHRHPLLLNHPHHLHNPPPPPPLPRLHPLTSVVGSQVGVDEPLATPSTASASLESDVQVTVFDLTEATLKEHHVNGGAKKRHPSSSGSSSKGSDVTDRKSERTESYETASSGSSGLAARVLSGSEGGGAVSVSPVLMEEEPEVRAQTPSGGAASAEEKCLKNSISGTSISKSGNLSGSSTLPAPEKRSRSGRLSSASSGHHKPAQKISKSHHIIQRSQRRIDENLASLAAAASAGPSTANGAVSHLGANAATSHQQQKQQQQQQQQFPLLPPIPDQQLRHPHHQQHHHQSMPQNFASQSQYYSQQQQQQHQRVPPHHVYESLDQTGQSFSRHHNLPPMSLSCDTNNNDQDYAAAMMHSDGRKMPRMQQQRQQQHPNLHQHMPHLPKLHERASRDVSSSSSQYQKDNRRETISSDIPSSPSPILHGKGQLKLALYVNCGLLTIHIVQAKHLTSAIYKTCSAYVRLSLVPDQTQRTHCKTPVAFGSNNPIFDRKFSFEVLQEDIRKRLLISIWNKDPSLGPNSEFMGCMSFGMKHLLSSNNANKGVGAVGGITGWYHLLTEKVGRHKHLQAATSKQRHGPTLMQHQQPKQNSASAAVTRMLKNGANCFGLDFNNYGVNGNGAGVEAGSAAAAAAAAAANAASLSDPEDPDKARADAGLRFDELSPGEQLRQNAIQRLLHNEANYIRASVKGIHQFSRPLRSRLIAAEEHQLLFQNIEKLVAISEFHVQELLSSALPYASASADAAAGLDGNRREGFLDSPGKAYISKLELVVNSYDSYCKGLSEARQLLENLVHSDGNFTAFLRECLKGGDDNDIEMYICRPVEHFEELIQDLRRVHTLTPRRHPDYDDLTFVVSGLEAALERIRVAASAQASESVSASTEAAPRCDAEVNATAAVATAVAAAVAASPTESTAASTNAAAPLRSVQSAPCLVGRRASPLPSTRSEAENSFENIPLPSSPPPPPTQTQSVQALPTSPVFDNVDDNDDYYNYDDDKESSWSSPVLRPPSAFSASKIHHSTALDATAFEDAIAANRVVDSKDSVLLLEDDVDSKVSSKSSGISSQPSVASSTGLSHKMSDVIKNLCFAEGVRPFQVSTIGRHFVFAGNLEKFDSSTRSWESVFVLLLSDLLFFTQTLTPQSYDAASATATSPVVLAASTRLRVVEAPLFLSEVLASDFGTEDSSDFSIAVLLPKSSDDSNSVDEDSFHCMPICLRAPSASKKEIWKAHLKHRLDIIHENSVECVVDDAEEEEEEVEEEEEERREDVDEPIVSLQPSMV